MLSSARRQTFLAARPLRAETKVLWKTHLQKCGVGTRFSYSSCANDTTPSHNSFSHNRRLSEDAQSRKPLPPTHFPPDFFSTVGSAWFHFLHASYPNSQFEIQSKIEQDPVEYAHHLVVYLMALLLATSLKMLTTSASSLGILSSQQTLSFDNSSSVVRPEVYHMAGLQPFGVVHFRGDFYTASLVPENAVLL